MTVDEGEKMDEEMDEDIWQKWGYLVKEWGADDGGEIEEMEEEVDDDGVKLEKMEREVILEKQDGKRIREWGRYEGRGGGAVIL